MTVLAPLRAARFAASARADLLQQRRTRIATGIRAVQACLVGQDDQHVGLHQIGGQRCQRVVVAELDLVGDHRVVLVDHRHHAEPEQREQGRSRIQIARPVGQVGMRQQDLCGADSQCREAALVRLREAHLANRGRRLQFVNLARTPRPAQPLHALGDRTAGYQQDLLAGRAQGRDLLRPLRDGSPIEPAALVGDQAAADLDHQPVRRLHDSRHARRAAFSLALGGFAPGTARRAHDSALPPCSDR